MEEHNTELETMLMIELVNTIYAALMAARKNWKKKDYFNLLREVEDKYMVGLGPDGTIAMDFSEVGEKDGIPGIKKLIEKYKKIAEQEK